MLFIYIQFVESEMSCISLSLLKILCLILDPIHFFIDIPEWVCNGASVKMNEATN